MRQPVQHWIEAQKARYAYRCGLDLARRGIVTPAIAALDQAIAHHPQPAQVHLSRGIIHWQQGNTQLALADFTQAASAPGCRAKAYGNRGLLRYQLGDEAGALEDWQQALLANPQDPLVHYNRALMFVQKKQYSEALSDLNQALAASPNLAEAYYHRGNVRSELGDLGGAIADWELALCNDLRIDQAKARLQAAQHLTHNERLTERLQTVLKPKNVTVTVHQNGDRLNIDLERPRGVGINYFTLPGLIRDRLIDWQVPNVRWFRLTGQVSGQSPPEWQQVYSLYQGQPRPPAHWQLAWWTTLLVFPPLGIPALVYAQQVGEAYRHGDYPLALQASKTVKALCFTGIAITASIGLSGLGYLSYSRIKMLPQSAPQAQQLTPPPPNQLYHHRFRPLL